MAKKSPDSRGKDVNDAGGGQLYAEEGYRTRRQQSQPLE